MTSLSAYEHKRLETIAANRAQLVALGIEDDIAAIRSAAKTQSRAPMKGSAINKKEKYKSVVPSRGRSLRQQNLDVEGAALPDKPVIVTPEAAPRRVRKPAVPLDAAKVSTGATSPEEAAGFLARLGEAKPEPRTSAKQPKKSAPPPSPSVLALSALSLAEDDIAKLVPERIFSLAVHPSATKLLVAAGDTWGKVGLWDVDATHTPVVTFEPHSRPVAGLRFPPDAPHLLLSCSHDGSVRCLDIGRGGGGAGSGGASFTEIYRAPDDAADGDYPSLHGLSTTGGGEGRGSHAVCRSDGAVVLLDARAPPPSSSSSGASPVLALHDKKVFSADFSPAAPHLLATASLDRTVALWDVRKVGSAKGRTKPLCVLEHGLSVTAARFSPSGRRLLTTCNDDLLRVFDGAGASGAAWSLAASVGHLNKTGRYLTSFQAEWSRGSDEELLCGSLLQPRGIDVFAVAGGGGAAVAAPRLEHDNLTSVVSLLAQHPTAPVLVASNSGGKCFCWR